MLLRVALLGVWLGALGHCQDLASRSDTRTAWRTSFPSRGKREASYWDDKRAPSGFFGVRGKKDPAEGDPAELPSALLADKRASASLMGFQGVRGKKTPSVGFMGMRGKKDDDYPWPPFDYEDGVDKRAPSGFFGVRGKKGPSSGFFGMRGKKGPSNSGFFGMRGKKGPSGFLGVRGKKDSSAEDIDELLQRLRESAAREQELEEMMDSRFKRSAVSDWSPLGSDPLLVQESQVAVSDNAEKTDSKFL